MSLWLYSFYYVKNKVCLDNYNVGSFNIFFDPSVLRILVLWFWDNYVTALNTSPDWPYMTNWKITSAPFVILIHFAILAPLKSVFSLLQALVPQLKRLLLHFTRAPFSSQSGPYTRYCNRSVFKKIILVLWFWRNCVTTLNTKYCNRSVFKKIIWKNRYCLTVCSCTRKFGYWPTDNGQWSG